ARRRTPFPYTTLFRSADFVRNQRCEIGIGDMSFRSGGAMPPHVSHTDGRCIDIRPLRTDGAAGPVQITDAQRTDIDAATVSVTQDRKSTRLNSSHGSI